MKATQASSTKRKWTDDPDVRRSRALLAALQRKAGKMVGLDDILLSSQSVWDGHDDRHTAICLLCRLESSGKIEEGWIGTGPGRLLAWMAPLPPE